jgi:hypothetical protein
MRARGIATGGGYPGKKFSRSYVNRPPLSELPTSKMWPTVDMCVKREFMKILGFRLSRYLAWLAAIRDASGWVGWEWYSDVENGAKIAASVVKMGRAIWTGRVGRKVWRERMRSGCGRCPLNRGWVCRLVDGNRELGCGCFTPFKGLVRAPYPGGCWAREHYPQSGFGWSHGA